MSFLDLKRYGLLFDLDNTLIPTGHCYEAACLETEKCLSNYCDIERAANIMKFFNERKNINKSDYTKFANEVDFWKITLEEAIGKFTTSGKIDCDAVYSQFQKSFLENMAFDKNVIEVIKKLKDTFKICILTNGSVTWQGPKLEICKAEKYFDAIVISGELNTLKPDPKIFHYACKKIGLENNQCVMIGDNLYTDIMGAQHAGLKAAVHLTKYNTGNTVNTDNVNPDFVIQDIVELVDIVREICK